MPDVMIVVSPRFTKPSLTAAETAFAIISSTSVHCVLADDLLMRRVSDDGCFRTVTGDDLRRVAAVGRRDDSRDIELVSHLYRSMCDGARTALAVLEAALNEEVLVLERFLDTAGDAVHRGNSLNRVVTGSRLARKHDGIRTIEDGVADIGDLSTRRARVALHGVEHLRSDDDRLASLIALADDLFLDQRNVLGRDLNAEVTAGDHDAVGLHRSS